MHEYVRRGLIAVFIAICGGLSKVGFDALYASFGFSVTMAAILAAGVVGIVLLFLAINWALGSALVRKIAFENAKHEGYWFQRVVHEERPYSISRIAFDPKARDWVYAGIGYGLDAAGEPVRGATWRSKSVSYDGETKRWLFDGEAEILERKPDGEYRCVTRGDVLSIVKFAKEDRKHRYYRAVLTDDIPDSPTQTLWSAQLFLYQMKPQDFPELAKIAGEDLADIDEETEKALVKAAIARFGPQMPPGLETPPTPPKNKDMAHA